ncbi:MAG: hypothetical protein M3179_13230 [Actinomycetota bacterium]|nr:hypothetical protein [Actinomycetota bacterium]
MEGVIEASTKVRADFGHVQERLLTEPEAIVGDRYIPTGRCGEVRATVAVEVTTSPGRHEEVLVELLVELLAVRSSHAKVAVPLSWTAVGWSRLFPTFAGMLESNRSEPGSQLRLRGTYSLALSPLGRFGQGVAGRRLARQAGSAFLEHAARRIDGEDLSRPDLAPWHPAAHTVTLAELLAAKERIRRQ